MPLCQSCKNEAEIVTRETPGLLDWLRSLWPWGSNDDGGTVDCDECDRPPAHYENPQLEPDERCDRCGYTRE